MGYGYISFEMESKGRYGCDMNYLHKKEKSFETSGPAAHVIPERMAKTIIPGRSEVSIIAE